MLTGLDLWQAVRDWVLTSGLHILIIVLGALIGFRSLRVLTTRLEKWVAGAAPTEEEAQRARTLAMVIHNTSLAAMITIAGLMMLRELDLDITPLIAAAGVAGVALGLGAQTLIKDIIGGFFILLEDHFAVGDSIRVGNIAGGVEKMTLRATFLRDLEGGIQATVIDDGAGFDPDAPPERPSLGLSGMRERIHLLGGTFEIESAPGRGTTILAWVPLAGGAS